MPMNDIEKLISATRKEHDKTKSAAKFSVFGNVVIPLLLIIGIVVAFCLLK